MIISNHLLFESVIKAKLEGFLESPGKTLLNNTDSTLHSRYARAIAYFRAPLYKKSIEEINSLLKDYPNDPFFLELKAQILSENGKVISSNITYVSFGKQKKLNREIKRAKILGLI